MSNKFANGAEWERMSDRLLGLCDSLGEAEQRLPLAWQPKLLVSWSQEQAWRSWRQEEARNIEDIHAAARELVRTNRLVHPTPEVLYFLGLRFLAAIRHLESLYAMSMDRAVSLVPFPPVSPEAYAEWLLTEWGDDHAGTVVFPEEVCVGGTSDPEPSSARR